MTPVYTWTNFRLGVVPEYVSPTGEKFKDVVTTISYVRTVVDSETNLSSQRTGQVYLSLPTTANYVPLANLTTSKITSFVENSLPMDTFNYLMKEELAVLVNNQNLTKPANTMVDNMIVTPAITIIKY